MKKDDNSDIEIYHEPRDAEEMDTQAARPTIIAEMGSEAHTSSAMPTLGSSSLKDSLKSASLASPPHLAITLELATPESQSISNTPQGAPTAAVILQRPEPTRRQSLARSSEKHFLNTLLASDENNPSLPPNTSHVAGATSSHDYFVGPPPLGAHMLHRKIWVRRPGASATLIQVSEDDVVDDVRENVLRKYANSLGRFFDAPDLVLRILPRAAPGAPVSADRMLGPEEPMARTLDAHYPGGQSVEEALIVDIPARRTPRQSPKAPLVVNSHLPLPHYYMGPEDARPIESDRDYFPPMQLAHVVPATSPHTVVAAVASQHSISILSTGQVPQLPSPGSRAARHGHRPRLGRTATTSPTVLQTPLLHLDPQTTHAVPPSTAIVPASIIPSPPISIPSRRTSTPPPARLSSPRPSKPRKFNGRQKGAGGLSAGPALPASLLDGAVPPINVLLVEDNIINLKLLEAFMKRLQVRWHAVMNGRDAVTRWRTGGFHLVLMDIQLPVMNGLDATKEIRRLERVNGVGVAIGAGSTETKHAPRDPGAASEDDNEQAGNLESSEAKSEADLGDGEISEGDRLRHRGMFKSPVIIVALTASSLQSDRHEALAAGCNDFLTKPVNYVWLERKVMEWGCMQALIDFSGWRKWKDLSTSGSAGHLPSLTASTAKYACTTATTSPTSTPTTTIATTAAAAHSSPIANGGSSLASPILATEATMEQVGSPNTDAAAGTTWADNKARRKAKRASLGGGGGGGSGTGGLSGVAEDSEGGERKRVGG